MSRGGERRRRLFVGLVPTAPEQHALAVAARGLRHGGRPVPAGNLHLTLAFLGALAAETAGAVAAALGEVTGPTLRLDLTRIGHYARTRVLWCAPDEPPAALLRLQAAVAAAVCGAGVALERRPFSPHVTVARAVARYPGPGRLADPVGWRIVEFHLVESRTLASGARHRAVCAFPLQD